MDRNPPNLQEMIRRALAAQMDLGVAEVILSPRAEQQQVASALGGNNIGYTAEAADLFGSAGPPAPRKSEFSSLEEHFQAIRSCQLCPLGETRNKFVYGTGNPEADLMFIGEAPGAEEDRLGEPFVGRAGRLLDRILAAIDLSRKDVYIGNILKCRPPNNRDPLPAEMEQCFPHLKEQIAIIRPRLICALGRIAGQALLKTTTPLGKLRRKWHEFEHVPLLVTYHPAALLRFPGYKKDTWEDMQTLRNRLEQLQRSGRDQHG